MSDTTSPVEQPLAYTLRDPREDASRHAAEQRQSGVWLALPGARSVSIKGLRVDMCRWPVDDPQCGPDVRYCGEAKTSTSSYCATHHAIAVGPSRSRVA